MQDRSGTGSLILDSKKQYAIKHWLELSSEEAIRQVELSLKDAPFQFGPWGESLSVQRFLFMNSTVTLSPLPDAGGLETVSGEPTISIDWSLPMTGEAQGALFARIRIQYERATAIVDNVQDRKRYRQNEEELMELRNMICFWFTIHSFCSTRISTFAELDAAICNGNTKDHEFRELLESRPSQLGVSMLPCARKEAVDQVREQEAGASLEVEKERLAVRDARWSFFQSALLRDQAKLQQVQSAPERLEALKHRKLMSWRISQAQAGERVIKAYKDKFLRCDLVAKAELAQQRINEFRLFVVSLQI